MDRPFDDDDRESHVITADGRRIGQVRDVEEDRATVERTEDHDSLTDDIREFLGWSDDDETHELRRDHVDRYEDNEFHLQPRR